MRYVIAVLEEREAEAKGIDEGRVVNLDKKLARGILKHWEDFVSSPEYPFYKMVRKSLGDIAPTMLDSEREEGE